MAHDATKVLLGATGSSSKAGSTVYESSPATYPAGTAVRLASTGLLSVVKANGSWAGVSMGKSLSDVLKTAVIRAGELVPILLESKRAQAVITITDYSKLVSGTDDAITIDGVAFTAQAGSATPTQATFQAASSNSATAISLAAQINAHVATAAKIKASVVGETVVLMAKTLVHATGNAYTLTYTDNDVNVGATVSGATFAGGGDAPDYVVKGAKVYIDDATGKADSQYAVSTVSDAVYVSGALSGINEDAATVYAAYIDMPAGL